MNVNTPIIYTHVNNADITKRNSAYTSEARIFGACSLPGRAIMFHCQLNNGAVYYRLPVSSFRDQTIIGLQFKLHELQPWDCPSHDMEVITYQWLYNQRVRCLKLNNIEGQYITTFDWSGLGTTAEVAHEHKCLHMIKLINGQFCLQPNNYLLWHEKSNADLDGSHVMLKTNMPYRSVEYETPMKVLGYNRESKCGESD